MHAAPHPNQVRSACERCRRQKLRCSRPSAEDACCARCARLGMPCAAGSQRRVGRPPRRGLVVARAALPSAEVAIRDGVDASSPSLFGDELDLFQGLAVDDPAAFLGLESPPYHAREFECIYDIGLSLHLPRPPSPSRGLQPPQAVVLRSVEGDFKALSSINVELHRLWTMVTERTSHMDFSEFICTKDEFVTGFMILQSLLGRVQDLLVIIRKLRDGLYPDTSPRMPPSPRSRSPGSIFAGDPTRYDRQLDSATALVVISCFVLFVKTTDLVLALFDAYVASPANGLLGPRDISLAGIKIVDYHVQGLLFAELTCHMVTQICLVMGVHTRWSAKCRRPGLCSAAGYREMLNKELGEVDGLWTRRPARLIDLAASLKAFFVEESMAVA